MLIRPNTNFLIFALKCYLILESFIFAHTQISVSAIRCLMLVFRVKNVTVQIFNAYRNTIEKLFDNRKQFIIDSTLWTHYSPKQYIKNRDICLCY